MLLFELEHDIIDERRERVIARTSRILARWLGVSAPRQRAGEGVWSAIDAIRRCVVFQSSQREGEGRGITGHIVDAGRGIPTPRELLRIGREVIWRADVCCDARDGGAELIDPSLILGAMHRARLVVRIDDACPRRDPHIDRALVLCQRALDVSDEGDPREVTIPETLDARHIERLELTVDTRDFSANLPQTLIQAGAGILDEPRQPRDDLPLHPLGCDVFERVWVDQVKERVKLCARAL